MINYYLYGTINKHDTFQDSVFVLHGAVAIVSLTTFILKVDFKEVVPANRDFSGSY